MARNAVFFHHADGVEVNRDNRGDPHTGQFAIGDGFLRGFVDHGGVENYYAHTLSADHFADFARRIRQVAGNSQPCRRVGHDMIGRNEAPGVLSLPGADIAPFAWRRRTHGNAAYSLCGLNRTIAPAQAMSTLGDLLTAPVQAWDALICTSRASRSATRYVLDGYAAYLEERMGARPPIELLLPVVPPGVDCAAFAHDAAASADRAQLRQGLGIHGDDVALLFVGHLSFHAMAHPLPFYVAAEAAARRTGRQIHLIQAGWFSNEAEEKEFRDGARALCPSVNAIFLDGRDDDVRRRIWRAADVFVSLSDNIHETVGLTPIEAMAAGLPVVVSDWNGHRETISDGVHGFIIPTWMPTGGEGRDLAFAPELGVLGAADDTANDRYCGAVSQSTAVDAGACIDALSVLCNDADKRHAMGKAGRDHACRAFDWSVVIKAYQDVWEELDHRRSRAAKDTRNIHAVPDVPLRSDPFAMFAAYPTSLISDATELRLIEGANMHLLDERLSVHMNNFATKHLLDRDGLEQVINMVTERGTATVRDIVGVFGASLRSRVLLSIGWLAKMYLLRLTGGVAAVLAPGEAGIAGGWMPKAEHDASDVGMPGQLDDALNIIEQQGMHDPDSGPGSGVNSLRYNELEGELADVPVPELLKRTTAARAEGDLAMVAACLHRASAQMPDDPDINVQMGELLALGERYDAAIACFRRAIQGYPDHLDAHRNLGKSLFLRGDEAEGIHSFRRAVRVAPEDGEARLLLGTALRRAGAVNEALQCLRIAMEIDPERAEAGYHLGLVCRAMDRTDDARQAFERALSTDPTNRFARAAILSMDVVTSGRIVSEQNNRRKIALHMTTQADYFALKPVFDALMEDHWPLFSGDMREISEFRPDAILTTSDRLKGLRDQMPECAVIQIPSAAIRRPDSVSPGSLLGASADAVCVVNDDERDAFLAAGLSQHRVWLTGLPLTDGVFERSVTGRGGRKQVLYMPDWRHEASAAPVMNEALATLCSADNNAFDLVIRPHPTTLENQPGWVDGWVDLAATCANVTVHVAAGVDYLALMAGADLLLADFSPLAFTFLAFDAPMVLLRPRPHASQQVRLGDQHAALLESVAVCVDEDAEAIEQVLKLLDAPDSGDETRARMRSRVFGSGADGHAAIRTVSALRDFLDA